MEKRVDASLLLSFYGAMLPARQQEMLRLYYEDDLSLSEIADLLGVTRQGVHDAIRRGEQQLLTLEAKLGLRARWARITEGLASCKAALSDNRAIDAITIIDTLLREEEEQDGI